MPRCLRHSILHSVTPPQGLWGILALFDRDAAQGHRWELNLMAAEESAL